MKKTAETKADADEYRCEHCNRSFVRPSTLEKHMCEPKRRWDERDRPANRIAFAAWLRFYQQFQPGRKKREYRDFASSAYYGGFVRFGVYCVDVGVINPLRYTEWLIKDNAGLDNWNSDKIYTRYLIEHLRTEDVFDALHRSMETMMNLAEKENVQLCDVFRFVNSNRICHLITNGKISPWIVYQSDTGKQFLSQLTDDNVTLIHDYIDPERWQIKFLRDPESVKQAKSIIREIRGL